MLLSWRSWAHTFNWLVKREQLIDIEGRKPPQTSLNFTRSEMTNVYFLVLGLLPGLAVVITVLTMNLMGDGLRDASDPYSH